METLALTTSRTSFSRELEALPEFDSAEFEQSELDALDFDGLVCEDCAKNPSIKPNMVAQLRPMEIPGETMPTKDGYTFNINLGGKQPPTTAPTANPTEQRRKWINIFLIVLGIAMILLVAFKLLKRK
jgi:hypothetical protein